MKNDELFSEQGVPFLYGSGPISKKHQKELEFKPKIAEKEGDKPLKMLKDILPNTMELKRETLFELICVCGRIYNKGKTISGKPGKPIRYIELCNFKIAPCCWQDYASRLSTGDVLANLIIAHAEAKAEQELLEGEGLPGTRGKKLYPSAP